MQEPVKIVKRDGRKELLDPNKIINAAKKALDEVNSQFDPIKIKDAVLGSITDDASVEFIQDCVEDALIKANEVAAAHAFIRYREQRSNVRELKSDLFRQFDLIAGKDSVDVEFKRENANINTDAPMGAMLKYGSESAKEYNLKRIIKPEYAKLHRQGDIHIHDLDFYSVAFNCVAPETNIIIKQNGPERKVSIKEAFPLLGNGTHVIHDTHILSRNGFTELQYLHIRDADEMMFEFITSNRTIECTGDHILPVIRDGREIELKASEIKQTDKLIVVHSRYSWEDANREDDGTIKSMRKYHYKGKVFDLTTGDHYFVANNILSHNCCQIPLGKLLSRGFGTGHGTISQPNSILSAAALACIALQSNQNDMFGGQSFPMWDYDLAPYVAKSFIKHCLDVLDTLNLTPCDNFAEKCLDYYNENGTLIGAKEFLETLGINEYVYDKALSRTNRETHQAMQAVVHNLNTMQSRAGSQVPFSSINYGTDTTAEGRMVVKATLDETDKGLGGGETPIFPVQIFKYKRAINGEPGTLNNDLFKLACKVSAKRLFPNFSFMDTWYNKQYYKEGHPETEMGVMGCVAAKEHITYKYRGDIFYEPIGDAFHRFSCMGFKEVNTKRSKYIVLQGIDIFDRGGWTECKGILCNKDASNWMELTAAGRIIQLTDDHPLNVNGARTQAKDIKVGDVLHSTEGEVKVEKIGYIDVVQDSYDVETASDHFTLNNIDSHNCRTRVLANDYSPENAITPGRGNFAFVTINLPALGIRAQHSVPRFFELFDDMIDACIGQLKDRFEYISHKHVYNYPFLMGQGVYLGSDKLKPDDEIGEVIKHASLSVGFVGLAECLVALIGKHHGESKIAQNLGLDIVHHLRTRMDQEIKRTGLNWSCFATPAEGLCSRVAKLNRKRFGLIAGVTDRDYVTNSSHVPVYYKISAKDKMRIEAPYHALCNAGHIGYVEVDGDLTKNPLALEALVKYAADLDMNYFSVNHPVDMCPVCGYVGVIGDQCPRCGFTETDGVTIEHLRSCGCIDVLKKLD